MRIRKLLIIGVIAVGCIAAITGCGKKEGASVQLSEQDYQTEVKDIFTQIQAITDEGDTDTAEGIKDMIDKIKPLYAKIKSLNPPSEYAEAHKKLVAGCDASEEILELSEEVIKELSNPTDDSLKKVEQLQEKITAYEDVQTEMENAVDEIYGIESETETTEAETTTAAPTTQAETESTTVEPLETETEASTAEQ